jgi:S-adenosylmethionine hydrolase
MALRVNGQRLAQANTFCSVPVGQAFWYRNSMGLVEIAVNRGRADRELGLSLGTLISFES